VKLRIILSLVAVVLCVLIYMVTQDNSAQPADSNGGTYVVQ